MKKIDNYENIKENTGFKKLPVGGYIVKILDAKDVPEKEYLKISFDIAKGDEKGFFAEAYKEDTREDKKWPNAGSFVRSYKEKALPMLKGFTNAIEASNKGYKWDWNEQGLKGKLVGVVIGEEEYINQKGAVRTRTYVNAVRSVETIEKGEFKIPELKKVDATKVVTTTAAEPYVDPFANDGAEVASAPVADSNPWDDSDVNPFA